MKKRILSILLALLMVITLMPTTAMAASPDPVFEVSVTSTGVSLTSQKYSENQWNQALTKVKDWRNDYYAVKVKMLDDYNGVNLDFGNQVCTLDLNGHSLGGSVVNAENVTVINSATDTSGLLSATGTYALVEDGLVDGKQCKVDCGTYTNTVSLQREKVYEIAYVKEYNGAYGGDAIPASGDNAKVIEKVFVSEGDAIALREGMVDGKLITITETVSSKEVKYAGFKNWVIDGENYQVGATFTPTEDTVITTAWAQYYAVTYSNVNPDDPTDYYTDYVLAGESITLPGSAIYELSSADFLGWLCANDKVLYSAESTFEVTGNTAFAAVFKSDKLYKVTYDLDGGTCVKTSGGKEEAFIVEMYEKDKTVLVLNEEGFASFAKNGCTFAGWTTDFDDKTYKADGNAVGANTAFIMPEKDVTLTAVWEKTKPYTVTYDLAGGTYVDSSGVINSNIVNGDAYAFGDKVQISGVTPEKEGFTFLGWKIGENDKLYQPTGSFKMPDHNVTLTAVWKQVAKYNVTYDLSGGAYKDDEGNVVSAIDGAAYAKGDKVTVSDKELTKSEDNLPQYGTLKFLGWRSDYNDWLYKCSETFMMPESDVKLTAEFAMEYTVDFVVSVPADAKVKDSTDSAYAVTSIASQKLYNGKQIAPVEEPAPYDVTANGVTTTYYFAGWKINDTDSIWNFADTFDPAEHVDSVTHKLTLTATWSTEKHYTVVFKDKITDMYAIGDSSVEEQAQYVLYAGTQLYRQYDNSTKEYSTTVAEATALTLTSVSENYTIGTGDSLSTKNEYPAFTRVDYTLGESDEDTTNDWYVVKPNGKDKFYYDDSKSLKENFEYNGKNIANYADANGVITLWANWNYKYAKGNGDYKVTIDTTELADATYAEYYSEYIVATTDSKDVGAGIQDRIYRNFFLSDSEGKAYTSEEGVSELPDGLYLNKLTGEIYGVPKETGTFKFWVTMESDPSEGAKQIAEQKQITIEIKALPITVDRKTDDANIYDKTYGDTDEVAKNKNAGQQGDTYESFNLTVKVGDTQTAVENTRKSVDDGLANISLITSTANQVATLDFAYNDAKTTRDSHVITSTTDLSGTDWLKYVGMKAVDSDPAFTGFTDTITFPVTRTQGEDAGSYKLYLDENAVTYTTGSAASKNVTDENSVYDLTIPEKFASKDVEDATAQYVFTINPVTLTLSLDSKKYTKTYGENDPVYPTVDLTTSTDNNGVGAVTPAKSDDSTTLTLTYPMGFTDTLEVAPTRDFGEDVKDGYTLYLTEADITTTATDKAEQNIVGDRTGADVKANYTFELTGYTGNTLTIKKRTLNFTASPSEYAYGTFKPKDNVTGTFKAGTLEGLANNEAIGVVDSAIVTIEEMASNAGYLKAGDYDVETTEDGTKLNFIITNNKWVEGENNATETANTVANYEITDLTLKITKADTLKVEGNKVNVTKGKQPTEANIQALATLTGALVNEGESDVVALKVTKYEADVNGAGSAESYTDNEDGSKTAAQALIEAIGTAGLTKDLAVKVTYIIDGADKDNYSLTTGTVDATLVAYTASSGGGGGGVYVAPTTTTDNVVNKTEDKTATTTATVTPSTTTVSGVKTTTAAVSSSTGTKIIEKAVAGNSAEVVINAATGTTVKEATPGTATEISIPAATLSQIVSKTGASVTFKSDAANVALDRTAVEAVAKAAGTTGNVKLIIKVIAQDANKVQVELKIETANGTVSDFNGGNVKVTVKLGAALAAKDLVCVYIDDNGVYHKVAGQKNTDGTYTFTTGHFSSYAVMAASDADKVIAEQAAKATDLTKALSLKARSVKTAKGNIKVTLTVDADEIKAIEDLGYTVKYKFYRSTKKSSSYKAAIEKTAKTYTNTTGTKGTRYYYKARVMVYDADGALLAKSALTQCKYACRIK